MATFFRRLPWIGANGLVFRHVPRYAFRYTCVYHYLFDIRAVLHLNRDVAVRAVDDAARLKTPTVVFHALNCRLVLAGEGNACQTAAACERPTPDARHAIRNRHRRQTSAGVERRRPDARHAIRDRHRRQTAATVKRIFSDARHAIRNRHRRQTTAVEERIRPDARHVGSDFDCLKFFYPTIWIIKQSGVDHRLLGYIAGPVVFLRSPVCERYLSLGVSYRFWMRNNPLFDVLWRFA